MVVGTGFIFAILLGVLVGMLSAMFGIGGGVVMVPMIRLLFHQAAAIASATSLFAILPTSIAGVISRHKEGNINYKIGALVGIAGALTSPLGATLATHLPGIIAMVLTAIVIIITAIKQFKDARRLRVEGDDSTTQAKASGIWYYLGAILLGLFIGTFSGFLGLGGGFIVVPMLCMLYGMTIKQASATSLVAIVILGIPGVIAHALYGNINYLLALSFILGSVPGAKLGALVVSKTSNRKLTIAFAIVLLIAGVALAVNELL